MKATQPEGRAASTRTSSPYLTVWSTAARRWYPPRSPSRPLFAGDPALLPQAAVLPRQLVPRHSGCITLVSRLRTKVPDRGLKLKTGSASAALALISLPATSAAMKHRDRWREVFADVS